MAEAEPYLRLGAAVAREHRLETAAFRIEARQCYRLILRGRWEEAERRLRTLLDAEGDPGASAVNPLAFLGRLLSRRGDPTAARYVQRAWELAAATGEDQKRAVAAGARIEWLWTTTSRRCCAGSVSGPDGTSGARQRRSAYRRPKVGQSRPEGE